MYLIPRWRTSIGRGVKINLYIRFNSDQKYPIIQNVLQTRISWYACGGKYDECDGDGNDEY